MFAGHLGAGLALKGRCKSVSLGTLFFAALLLDSILWVLVLFGWESVHSRAPAPTQMAVSALITFVVLVAYAFWVDRNKTLEGVEKS